MSILYITQYLSALLLLLLALLALLLQGLIQSVYELSDSSGLIITVGKYLTPRGVDIDRFGIAPDFTTLPDPNAAEASLNACKLEAAAAVGAGPGQQQQEQQRLQPQVAGAAVAASGAA